MTFAMVVFAVCCAGLVIAGLSGRRAKDLILPAIAGALEALPAVFICWCVYKATGNRYLASAAMAATFVLEPKRSKS